MHLCANSDTCSSTHTSVGSSTAREVTVEEMEAENQPQTDIQKHQ